MAESDQFPLVQRPATGPLRTMQLVRDRAVEAVLGQSGLNHPGLVAEVRRQFGAKDVATGALVREPVIEGAAPFKVDGRTFADCAGTLLHPDVISAISSPQAGDYRFPPEAQPYRHQIAAWQHLTAAARNSVLVSSGTGSGKTECFMMPLLHDLATEAAERGRLSGVRALALYPLNALIASQQERLRAWTAPFAGKVRFGLYNGLTPERLKAQDKPGPEQAGDRETLRSDPPPILVTNVTMLEYMLVRRIDRPLIDNSRGQLRWIILDEAHGYVGSSAAEIALLLRRVLLTFGVKAEDVRFVATSATIGGEGVDVTDELRRFLRDISGAPESRIHVVLGERDDVLLPTPAPSPVLSAGDLRDRDRVAASPAVQDFVREAERKPVALARAEALLQPVGQPLEDVIEAIADNRDAQRGALLPLRIHGFLRAVPGLWSCIDPQCADAPADWPFGAIKAERVDACPCCKAPVLEVMTCRECGEVYLDCEERNGHLQPRFTPAPIDEFAALREHEIADDSAVDDAVPTEEPAGPTEDEPAARYDADLLVLATRTLERGGTAHVVPTTGERQDRAGEGTLPYRVHRPDTCAACGATASSEGGTVLRPFRYGAPFLIGNAAPVLLEGVEPRKPDEKPAYRLPSDGRQLLSFTDSRQGSARFAASLQTTSERAFVRSHIYHAVQGSMAAVDETSPDVIELRASIARVEPHLAILPEPARAAVAEGVARDKEKLAKLLAPNTAGLAWVELRDNLAARPEVHHWMSRVWGPREDRYRKSAKDFAEFLLLREFNRRPRRGNTAETMGLARLRLDAIDTLKVGAVPAPLSQKGKTLADWQGLLYSIVDMTIRGRGAIRADWDDLHWLHTGRPLSTLLAPGERSEVRRELNWPTALAKPGSVSNLLLILEHSLQLDRREGADRRDLNEVFEAAWQALRPALYARERPDFALDLTKARIAPVVDAWLCPVTGRVLPETALGLTQYGHREGLRTAAQPPRPITLPVHPHPFPTGDAVEAVRAWLATDPKIQTLREQGVWANLHDRLALFSPYMRAAEHSAQQPPERLRRFEGDFKKGEINILNCSTTMEMGVDIGSVSAVMMTNVPPALANYRQRVGRAGRRRQSFASSLTYTRDTPLDRETFRDPVFYLSRQTRAPRVRLDSRRIVQRHVNALLLARWFASAGGEAMKARAGDFFGCPEEVGAERPASSPAQLCRSWITAPSTLRDLGGEVQRLIAGTVLAGDGTVLGETARALELAETGIVNDWQTLQAQAGSVTKEEGRASIAYQLKRLVRENLLKELAVRGVLPGHGLPTAVVPFVHDDKPVADDGAPDKANASEDASRRRRSFPSRTLDIAIRDYAPGAEVVVDGLVYKSAGVTLNWQRPVDDSHVREVQSIRVFWLCPSCGAADCAPATPEHCPACQEEIPLKAQLRFIEPGGFTVDMGEKPHADTDSVQYVEPEAEQIVARNAAWQPLSALDQGRVRASAEGLVFYSSRGKGRHGYHVCLECGRAEPASEADGGRPLQAHRPLRGTRRNADGLCPGTEKTFKITDPIALGYEAITDVAELQPAGLQTPGAAWAAIAALREALARRIGIETNELGLAVRPARTPLGQRTHSLFLYDRAAGGAGFAPNAVRLFDELMPEAARILDCQEPGCTHGCSACVLTADLFRHQEIIDRKAALAWAQEMIATLGHVPDEDRPDLGRSGTICAYCRELADDLTSAAEGATTSVTVWAGPDTDPGTLTEGTFAFAARRITALGKRVTLVVEPDWLDALDPAARLALRDTAKMLQLDLRKGAAPVHANGARSLAQIDGVRPSAWASRDHATASLDPDWGRGTSAPVVRFPASPAPLSVGIALDTLLPPSGTHYVELHAQLDGDLAGFGQRFAALFAGKIKAAGSGTTLTGITYNDRYLQTPLTIRLLVEALAGLRTALGSAGAALPVAIVTNPLKPNERQPFAPDHDWRDASARNAVLLGLLERAGFAGTLSEHDALHGRVLVLQFADAKPVRLILDQGFGPWRAPKFAKFEFGDSSTRQTQKLDEFNAIISSRGASYGVIRV